MLISSELGDSVFKQTGLDLTDDNRWWVEVMLQKIKINGLVKMINGSKKLEPDYIAGYMPRYKWAHRIDGLDITDCRETLEVLSDRYFKEPFPWVGWNTIVLLSNIDLLIKSIELSKNRGVRHLAYLGAIYAGQDIDKIVVSEFVTVGLDDIKSDIQADWMEARRHFANSF